MKKILFVGSKEYPVGCSNGEDNRSIGGIELGMERIINGLKNKFDITIITRKFKNTQSRELNQNFKIIRVKWIKGYLKGVSYNFNSFLYLLFRTLDYNIVFTSGLFATMFLGILKKIRFKRFELVCRWDTPLYKYKSNFFYIFERFTYKYLVDVFVFKELNEVNRFKELYNINKLNYSVVGFGVPFSNIKHKKNKILTGCYVGRLSNEKNILFMLTIFKKVIEIRNKQIVFKIFGAGPLSNDVKSYIEKNNLNKNIKYFGYITNSINEIANSDFLILLSKYEGLPNVVIEAMSVNTPVIMSDIGLFNKNIVYLVNIDDRDKLITQINLFIENKELKQKIVKNAHNYFIKNYSYDNMINNYISLFNKI